MDPDVLPDFFLGEAVCVFWMANLTYYHAKNNCRYMKIKKGSRSKDTPPADHSSGFYRVNKLELDSGVVIYQSEIQCFDINYNAIDLKVRQEGQFDLPSPAVRLG